MRLAAALVLGLTGCSGAGAGDTPPASTGPTIVSLNPCADAILAEVAAPGQLLAISHYSHDPSATSMPLEEALQYAITGGTVEEVLALDPDIVVADSFLSPARKRALEAADVEVVQLGIVTTPQESIAQIEELAETAGRPIFGAVLATQIELAWIDHRDSGPRVSTLLWQEGGIVAGEGSLAHALLEHTGFASHSAARGLGQGAYVPLEQVLADPPELILAAGDEPMLGHPVLQQLDGVRYETFDSSLLYCGGPTIPRALDRLAAIRRAIG